MDDAAPEPVGVLGGTFDPVHTGHLQIADLARRKLALSRVLLLPTARPPHKPPEALSPPHHRVAMLRLAVDAHKHLEICTLELTESRVCYSIDTLRALRDGRPPLRPIFIVGMDTMLEITTWRSYRQLLRDFDLAVVDRMGGELFHVRHRLAPDVAERIVTLEAEAGGDRLSQLEPGRGGRIFHLAAAPIPISSSVVRARAAEGQDVSDLVPTAVAEYIQRTGLYRREDTR